MDPFSRFHMEDGYVYTSLKAYKDVDVGLAKGQQMMDVGPFERLSF